MIRVWVQPAKLKPTCVMGIGFHNWPYSSWMSIQHAEPWDTQLQFADGDRLMVSPDQVCIEHHQNMLLRMRASVPDDL